MNRIVREHYPVSKLPEELRTGFDLDADVRVVVERIEAEKRLDPKARQSLLDEVPAMAASVPKRSDKTEGGTVSITGILEEMQDYRVFNGDPVDRVRALRAEWDYREELHDRIRRGDLD